MLPLASHLTNRSLPYNTITDPDGVITGGPSTKMIIQL